LALHPYGPEPVAPQGAGRPRAAREAAAHRKDLLMTAQRTAPPPHTGAVLREAADDDVPELVDLVQAAYRGEGGWPTEAHLVDGHRTDAGEVRAMLDDPQVTLLVAEHDGALVGCSYTRREPADAA